MHKFIPDVTLKYGCYICFCFFGHFKLARVRSFVRSFNMEVGGIMKGTLSYYGGFMSSVANLQTSRVFCTKTVGSSRKQSQRVNDKTSPGSSTYGKKCRHKNRMLGSNVGILLIGGPLSASKMTP